MRKTILSLCLSLLAACGGDSAPSPKLPYLPRENPRWTVICGGPGDGGFSCAPEPRYIKPDWFPYWRCAGLYKLPVGLICKSTHAVRMEFINTGVSPEGLFVYDDEFERLPNKVLFHEYQELNGMVFATIEFHW